MLLKLRLRLSTIALHTSSILLLVNELILILLARIQPTSIFSRPFNLVLESVTFQWMKFSLGRTHVSSVTIGCRLETDL